MADVIQTIVLFTAVAVAILVPFVVVPEIMKRKGHNPRSGTVRGLVWASFFLLVFVPALASGFVFTVGNPADWLIFVIAIVVAILYDYYRLNPHKVPWARART